MKRKGKKGCKLFDILGIALLAGLALSAVSYIAGKHQVVEKAVSCVTCKGERA